MKNRKDRFDITDQLEMIDTSQKIADELAGPKEIKVPKLIEAHARGEHDEDHPDCILCLIPSKDAAVILTDMIKPIGKSPEKSKSDVVTDAILQRWRDGYPMNELAKEVGIKRNKFRREIIKAVGGKEAFRALRTEGAGGHRRAIPNEAGVPSTLDDTGVKIIRAARMVDGWKSRVMYVGPKKESTSISVFISPEGVEYVRAKSNEKADLVYKPKGAKASGLPPVRLRKLDTSAVGRKKNKEEELLAKGEAALKRDREAKKKKRSTRKGGLSAA